jgi:hypothetical protein
MMGALTVERVGAQGDGVAQGEKGPVFVPLHAAWRARQLRGEGRRGNGDGGSGTIERPH